MHIAFYKGRGGPRLSRLIGAAIRARTNGIYSHCEIKFSDGMSFSSSEMDGGVRFKQIDYEPEKWDLFRVHMSPEKESIVRAWCQERVGLRYDWIAILFYLIGVGFPGNSRWFCSEILTAAMQQAGLFSFLNPSSTSPQTLSVAVAQRAADYTAA